MPHLIQQLSANRALGGLHTGLAGCSLQAATLRQGPDQDDGPGAAWLVFLCPAHSDGLPAWPAAASRPDDGSMPCGTVLDYRTAQQQLQSHADLTADLSAVCCLVRDRVRRLVRDRSRKRKT